MFSFSAADFLEEFDIKCTMCNGSDVTDWKNIFSFTMDGAYIGEVLLYTDSYDEACAEFFKSIIKRVVIGE